MFKKTLLTVAIGMLAHSVYASPSSTTTPQVPTKPVFGVQSINNKTLEEISLENKKRMEELSKSVAKTKKEVSPSEWSESFASYGTYDDEDVEMENIFRMLGIVDQQEPEAMPPDLEELLKINPVDEIKSNISEMRYKVIYESALSYGIQAGLARQSRVISDRLETISSSLDFTYNFQRFIMQGNILPPVISQVKDAFEQESDDVIHIGLNNYEMISEPRLVTSAPSWRSYLQRVYDKAQTPRISLDPESRAEKALWAKTVEKGFNRGVAQANRILAEGWRTLIRDYTGIITYHELLNKRIVSAPYVTASTRDVVGDSRRMTVGDVTLTIAVKPEFILDRNQWGKNARSGQKGYIGGKGRGAESGGYIELKTSTKKKK